MDLLINILFEYVSLLQNLLQFWFGAHKENIIFVFPFFPLVIFAFCAHRECTISVSPPPFFFKSPQKLFKKEAESAIVNPNNERILWWHLVCVHLCFSCVEWDGYKHFIIIFQLFSYVRRMSYRWQRMICQCSETTLSIFWDRCVAVLLQYVRRIYITE